MAEDRILARGRLIVPHPRMTERNFVLIPLLEIAPEAVHPTLKRKISDLNNMCPDKSAVIKIAKKRRRLDSKESKQT
jgi:2-amino-4-hydroxy-6-hydroxymethyldihydropteridine diphosphokinase